MVWIWNLPALATLASLEATQEVTVVLAEEADMAAMEEMAEHSRAEAAADTALLAGTQEVPMDAAAEAAEDMVGTAEMQGIVEQDMAQAVIHQAWVREAVADMVQRHPLLGQPLGVVEYVLFHGKGGGKKMKVFQVLNGRLHWLSPYKDLSQTVGLYAPNIRFIELPDDTKAREGWLFDEATGTASQPPAPEGWAYDEDTGTFYNIAEKAKGEKLLEIEEKKQSLTSTDYRIIKQVEAQLLGTALPYTPEEMTAFIKERQAERDRINELESELAQAEQQ